MLNLPAHRSKLFGRYPPPQNPRKIRDPDLTANARHAQQVHTDAPEVDGDRARFRHGLLDWYSATAMLRIYSLDLD